jgi:hypothetical protein
MTGKQQYPPGLVLHALGRVSNHPGQVSLYRSLIEGLAVWFLTCMQRLKFSEVVLKKCDRSGILYTNVHWVGPRRLRCIISMYGTSVQF